MILPFHFLAIHVFAILRSVSAVKSGSLRLIPDCEFIRGFLSAFSATLFVSGLKSQISNLQFFFMILPSMILPLRFSAPSASLRFIQSSAVQRALALQSTLTLPVTYGNSR
jgi:hypothetical protein